MLLPLFRAKRRGCSAAPIEDVRTYDFNQWPRPGANGRTWKFLGTLRPLYAYELRARALEDLARFGLNVPPALGSSAAAKAIVSGEAEDFEFLLAPPGQAACSLVLSRGGADTSKVIFYESAVARLIGELNKIEAAKLADGETRKALLNVQRKSADQDKLMYTLTATGIAIGKDRVAGIQITTKAVGRGATGRPWCQIVLSSELISAATAA